MCKTINSYLLFFSSSKIVAKTLQDKVSSLEYDVLELNASIEQDKLTISNLKKRRNEKTAAVSKYSSNDIIEFLTNRYKQDTTITK